MTPLSVKTASEAEPISRETWETMWRALEEAGRTQSLSAFSATCDRIKAEWRARYPGVAFSNARYEVYVEHALRRGMEIPAQIIASLSMHDIRFDAHAFPHLAPLLRVRP